MGRLLRGGCTKLFTDRPGAVRLVMATLLWSLASGFAVSYAEARGTRGDYAPVYAASLMLLQGTPAAMYSQHPNMTQLPDDIYRQLTERGYPGPDIPLYFYHPSIAMAFVPLALLDYQTAQRLFTAAMLLSLFVFGLLLWRKRWLGPVESGGVVLFMLLCYMGRESILFGQFQTGVVGLVGAAMLLPPRAAPALALPPVVIAKPFLAPLLLFRPRTLPWVGGALALWLAAPLVYGTGLYGAYFGMLTERAGHYPVYVGQQSLLAHVIRVVEGVPLSSEQWIHLYDPSLLSKAVYILLALPLLALGLWQLKRHREPAMRMAGLIGAVLAASPFFWAHYGLLLLLPLLALLRHRPARLTLLLALGGLLLANLPQRYHLIEWLFFLRFNVYLGALLSLAAVALARGSPRGVSSGA